MSVAVAGTPLVIKKNMEDMKRMVQSVAMNMVQDSPHYPAMHRGTGLKECQSAVGASKVAGAGGDVVVEASTEGWATHNQAWCPGEPVPSLSSSCSTEATPTTPPCTGAATTTGMDNSTTTPLRTTPPTSFNTTPKECILKNFSG